jgi:hypothetical protein
VAHDIFMKTLDEINRLIAATEAELAALENSRFGSYFFRTNPLNDTAQILLATTLR